MTTIKLTAYNEDVQRYIERGNTEAKKKIFQHIKGHALKNGINFNRLFPSGSKKMKVLDEIIYMLSGGGICKISSNTLAKNTDASLRTVYDTVKGIKQLGLIIVGGLADGKNKYIFLYKNHADFIEILAHVFYLDAEQIAEQVAERENIEKVDITTLESEKTSLNSNNLFNKQEKDNIKQAVESEITDSDIRQYTNNEKQIKLYDVIKNSKYHDDIKASASIIALRAGSNIDIKLFHVALVAVNQIDKFLYFGGVADSVPALFDRIYHDRIKYSDYYRQKAPAPVKERDTSFYYNWLEEDGREII